MTVEFKMDDKKNILCPGCGNDNYFLSAPTGLVCTVCCQVFKLEVQIRLVEGAFFKIEQTSQKQNELEP